MSQRRKRAAADTATDKPDKKKTRKKQTTPAPATGMGRFILLACVVGGLILGGFAAISGWLAYGPVQAQRAQALAHVLLQQPASLINQQVLATEAQLAALAQSSNVRQGFAGDADTLSLRLTQQLPGVTVTLVPMDERVPRDSLSFNARELVQQARTSGQAPLVLIPGNPARLIAARQSSGGEGIVVVEQSLDTLAGLLRRIQLPAGGIEVRQQGNATTLLSIGRPQGDTLATTQANADLTLTYRGSPALDEESRTLFLSTAAGALLLLCLGLALVLRQVGHRIVADAGQLARGGNTFTFPPLADAAQTLALRTATQAPPPPASRTPAPADAFLDILVEEDSQLLGNSEPPAPARTEVPAEIFRACDIRGIVGKTLNNEIMTLIGRAIGSEAGDAGQQTLLVARDGRTASEGLTKALVAGLLASGRDVIDLGAVPTPVLYYGTAVMDVQSGVMVTGSHNPASYNGVKVVLGGETLHGERILALHQRIIEERFTAGEGRAEHRDIRERYLHAVSEDIVLARPLKVVVDCGNGITGPLAPQLFSSLGCEVIPLFTDVDGHFPNHHPDPGRPENLHALIQAVKQQGADLGIAFDGDGDRLGVVTPAGEIIWPDRLLMLYARDLLSRSPGADIIFDVRASRELAKLISRMGGRPMMWRAGHALMKARLRETGATLAGETSGHMFFADRWHGADDALYAAARLLEILALETGDADTVFARLKTGITTPELLIPASEQTKFALVEKLQARQSDFAGGSISTLDGLRVDFDDGWGLVRASNTMPALSARFEGRDKAALQRIVALFRATLQDIEPKLKLPF